jgi:hypothetical protein
MLTTIEPGLIIVALCLATLSPLLPTPKSTRRNRRVPRNDLESHPALRGIPLERNFGNTTIIEGNTQESKRKSTSKLTLPLKAKTKGGFNSTDTLVQQENGQTAWDSGIMKTTDVITFSDEDLTSKVRHMARVDMIDTNDARLSQPRRLVWSDDEAREEKLCFTLCFDLGLVGNGCTAFGKQRYPLPHGRRLVTSLDIVRFLFIMGIGTTVRWNGSYVYVYWNKPNEA